MEENFNKDPEQVFIEWCIARGFTAETPYEKVLQAMADEDEQRIQEAEEKGEQMMKRLELDGSIVMETIEEARWALEEFKRVFGLE